MIMMNQENIYVAKFSHDFVLKSGYSCDQQESTRLSKNKQGSWFV